MTCQHTTRKGKPCPNQAIGRNSDGKMSCHVHYEGGTYRQQQRARTPTSHRLAPVFGPTTPLEPIGKVASLIRMSQGAFPCECWTKAGDPCQSPVFGRNPDGKRACKEHFIAPRPVELPAGNHDADCPFVPGKFHLLT